MLEKTIHRDNIFRNPKFDNENSNLLPNTPKWHQPLGK